MKPRLSAAAEKELYDAALWYEERRQGLGADFLADARTALERIGENPERFALLETVRRRRRGVRRCLLKRFPYAIVFITDQEEIRVVAIAHTSRRPNYWLDRE